MMTTKQRNDMVGRMNVIHGRIEQRRNMLSRLDAMWQRFPDVDLDDRLQEIKAEAEKRNAIDEEAYGKLEDEFDLLGGNDPDGPWEEDEDAQAV